MMGPGQVTCRRRGKTGQELGTYPRPGWAKARRLLVLEDLSSRSFAESQVEGSKAGN